MNLSVSQASAIIKVADLPVYGVYKYEQLIKFTLSEDRTGYHSTDMQNNLDVELSISASNLELYSDINEAVQHMQEYIIRNRPLYSKRLAFYDYLETTYPESFI